MKFKESSMMFFVCFLFGLFPILPFNLKPMTVVIPLLIGVWVFIKHKKACIKKAFVYNSIVFILYLLSILYSDDVDYAIQRTITVSSMILLPLFYIFISSLKVDLGVVEKIERLLFYVFYCSTIILSIVIYLYIYKLGYFENSVSYGYSISYIEHHLWVFNDHPIYLSIYIGLSLIFSLSLIKSNTSKKLNVLIILGNLILLSVLVFLFRKGVLLATIVSFFFFLFKNFKSGKRLFVTTIGVLMLVFVCFILFSNSSRRIIEVINSTTYTKVLNDEPRSSTSIRLGVYQCATKNLTKAGLFGFGVGDTKNVLMHCYENTSEVLVQGKYNTHNQYLNFWLSFGFIGLIVFIWFLFQLFRLSLLSKDFIFMSVLIFYCIIMLVENLLDRQNGLVLFAILINFFTYKSISRQNKYE
ncbi:O-antigen ligase family protein [Tamlana agarivorans]|uniref:O-antigen ligase family protein n=1 Tax=Pseudotamlana agarivorans TaxID=481183 RepID=A0ACC5U5Q1_9FLAO|nr:O-antigen ligase family protein [Tamlana agarivorans]MBU2949620.1 O-antigen ligase family protein [Tamlana agarivorans]